MRQDLLALTIEDLSTLSKRATVKRASRDLETGLVTAEISEQDGTVMVEWSDGERCILRPNERLNNGQCSCPAMRVCRHLVRSVLAYQEWVGEESLEGGEGEGEVWNPGEIGDGVLEEVFGRRLKKVRAWFDAGLTAELLIGQKPSVRFYELSCTVRFMVPYDLAYTSCNCADPDPCDHAALAVWAFRLAPEVVESEPKVDGETEVFLIETRRHEVAVPVELFGRIEQMLEDLLELGIAGADTAVAPRLLRLADECAEEGLLWPGMVLQEVRLAYEQYRRHDARFDPLVLVHLIGELLVRMRYIRRGSTAVPELFVRGGQYQTITDVSTATLVGLGCGVEVDRTGVTIGAYLQDLASGEIVTISRRFDDPAAGGTAEPESFAALSKQLVALEKTLVELGKRQLMVKGGQRQVGGQFEVDNAPAVAYPQQFEWQKLVPPVYAETFAEVRSRLAARPPVSLQPRLVGGRLFVCPITTVSDVHFDFREQQTRAVVVDTAGEKALLVHAHTHRGREGGERLLYWLTSYGDSLIYLSAETDLDHKTVVFRPLGLVFERDGQRELVQPWVDGLRDGETLSQGVPVVQRRPRDHIVADFMERLQEAVSVLWVDGVQRMGEQELREWELLAQRASEMGFTRLDRLITAVTNELIQKRHALTWQWREAVEPLCELMVVLSLARHLTVSSLEL